MMDQNNKDPGKWLEVLATCCWKLHRVKWRPVVVSQPVHIAELYHGGIQFWQPLHLSGIWMKKPRQRELGVLEFTKQVMLDPRPGSRSGSSLGHDSRLLHCALSGEQWSLWRSTVLCGEKPSPLPSQWTMLNGLIHVISSSLKTRLKFCFLQWLMGRQGSGHRSWNFSGRKEKC